MIEQNVIESAKHYGMWINKTAYFIAQKETASNPKDLDNVKSKVLLEFESAIYSAKTTDKLASQIQTRVGRLTTFDAPNSASLFFEELFAGKIELDVAKNMLVTFMRIKGVSKKNTTTENQELQNNKIDENDNEDYTDD